MKPFTTFSRWHIEESAYPNEFFVLLADDCDTRRELSDILTSIQNARPEHLRNIERYNGNEVHQFLMRSVSSHFHGLVSVLNG